VLEQHARHLPGRVVELESLEAPRASGMPFGFGLMARSRWSWVGVRGRQRELEDFRPAIGRHGPMTIAGTGHHGWKRSPVMPEGSVCDRFIHGAGSLVQTLVSGMPRVDHESSRRPSTDVKTGGFCRPPGTVHAVRRRNPADQRMGLASRPQRSRRAPLPSARSTLTMSGEGGKTTMFQQLRISEMRPGTSVGKATCGIVP